MAMVKLRELVTTCLCEWNGQQAPGRAQPLVSGFRGAEELTFIIEAIISSQLYIKLLCLAHCSHQDMMLHDRVTLLTRVTRYIALVKV